MRFCRAHPCGELEDPHLYIGIINERIKFTTLLAILTSLYLQHQSNSSVDNNSGIQYVIRVSAEIKIHLMTS
jgi:hypothetical protein